jgi:hypothetical protein
MVPPVYAPQDPSGRSAPYHRDAVVFGSSHLVVSGTLFQGSSFFISWLEILHSNSHVLEPRFSFLHFCCTVVIMLLTMNTLLFSWMFLALVVEGAPTTPIVTRHEAGDAARAETGTVGRLVYGIVSTVCLCAMSFAMGKILEPNFRCNIILTHSRPSCNTIRKKEKAAVRLVAFPHPDRGGHDARHLRRNSGVRPQSHHVQGMPGLNHSLPLLVLFFKDPAVSNPIL